MFNSKKIFLGLLFCYFLFSFLSGFCLATAEDLEIIYPDLPNATRPTSTKTLLPDYIKYIFTLSVALSGMIVFGVLIYGGARYLTSTGNPTVLSDAKDRIFSGILGLAILLSAYLILTTINPQLIILRGRTTPIGGVTIYKEADCAGDSKGINRAEETFDEAFPIESMKFLARPRELEVRLYSDENCTNDEAIVESETACRNISHNTKCIKLIRKIPGVYLCDNTLDAQGNCQGEERFIPGDTDSLGDFENKARAIRIRNTGDVEYGAVLHLYHDRQGLCEVFLGSDNDLASGDNPFTGKPNVINSVSGDRASSVTIFLRDTHDATSKEGEGVWFCDQENEKDRSKCAGPYRDSSIQRVSDEGIEDNSVTSIIIDGSYIAILFEHPDYKGSKNQVFRESDSNLRNDPIGRCGCIFGDWGCGDCLSSFIVLPTK